MQWMHFEAYIPFTNFDICFHDFYIYTLEATCSFTFIMELITCTFTFIIYIYISSFVPCFFQILIHYLNYWIWYMGQIYLNHWSYGIRETYMFHHLKSIKITSIMMCPTCNHLYIVRTRLTYHQLACSI